MTAAANPESSALADVVRRSQRRTRSKPVLIAFSLILLGACDTAHSTKTGQVTSVSSSSVCINPEDKNQVPYCLEVSDAQAVADIAENSCVRAVGTLDGKLVRIESLDRSCRVPTR